MSVLDQFRLAEEALTQRLHELRPLADEYRELEQIAKRRGLPIGDEQTNGAAAAETPPAARSRRRRARPRAETRPKPGTRSRANRREDIVRLVAQRPGITIKEIGDELGVDPTGLYRPVRELQRRGTITKQGAQLTPAS